MLNYKQLFYFWNIAKSGGITRAAEQLHITPQTVSGQLAELERSLNTQLFHRNGKRLELTAAGKLAYSHATEIFQLGQELEGLLHGNQSDGELALRIGVADVVYKSIAYRLLAPAYTISEPVRLHCIEGKLEELFAELSIHKLDIVISDRPLPAELGIKGYNHLLGESAIAFYALPELAELYRENFPASLNGAPFLFPGISAAVHLPLQRWFTKHHIHPRIVGEFDNTTLMRSFAQGGVGIFPAPEVITREAASQHGVEVIGRTEEVVTRFYAISVQRKLTHPAILAISEAAKHSSFNMLLSSEIGDGQTDLNAE